jgi:hypothetical protein
MITTRDKAPTEAKVLGAWAKLAFANTYGTGDKKYSDFDLMLRQEYKLAWEGDPTAIKFMLGLLDANLKARDYHYPEAGQGVIWRGGRPPRYRGGEPRNADMALLLLGICAVSNEWLKRLRGGGELSYEEKLRTLRPDFIEAWVFELAEKEPSGFWGVGDSTVHPKLSDWNANKAEVLKELMRERGPGATRFKPGQSGNLKGRPCKRPAKYPYDDFFMETFEVQIGGVKHTLTRLDALLKQLANKAAKGDIKILRLLAPRLARSREMEWEKNNVIPRPRIIRG